MNHTEMNFKPNEFFISLVEFIAMSLPDTVLAVLVYFVETKCPLLANHVMHQYAFSDKANIIFWGVNIFSSFGLGYFFKFNRLCFRSVV